MEELKKALASLGVCVQEGWFHEPTPGYYTWQDAFWAASLDYREPDGSRWYLSQGRGSGAFGASLAECKAKEEAEYKAAAF